MSRWFYWFFAFISISTEVTCLSNGKNEEMCLNYYKTGENFDLKLLNGIWHAVYYWPAIQHQRDNCAVVDFKTVSRFDAFCKENIPVDATVIKSSYTNSTGKQIDLYYYGEEEVKYQIRACDRVSKYLYVDVDDGYVMGINCSNGGRGVLLARNLPTHAEVEAVIDNIDIMTGRQGSSDCNLA